MTPRLVLCRCDSAWGPCFAVCPDCELAWLEERLAARLSLRPDHPVQQAYVALLDALDADDRARDLADAYRMAAAK